MEENGKENAFLSPETPFDFTNVSDIIFLV